MRLFLFIFLTSVIPVFAQNFSKPDLDSLYSLFLRIHNVSTQTDYSLVEPDVIKCGLGITHQVKMNINNFSPEQQQVLKPLLNRPVKHKSMVSPSGFFRIHYDTSGSGIPRYNPAQSVEQNVMHVAAALDSTFSFEINYLGYVQPPPDFNYGGDDKYDVYINSLGGIYGYTTTDTSLGDQKYTSYVVIDNDYIGFFSTGLKGMQVTVAHEFHHSIQLGGYTGDKINDDLFFYELTATSMEEFVYDSVNDYYAYIPAYFNNTSVSLNSSNGYEVAHWNIFLKDKFGYEIIKTQWILLRSMRALSAINASLNDYSSNFKDAFHEFGLWNFFTRNRAKEGQYFEEGNNYPLVKPVSSINFTPPDEIISGSSKAVVNSYINFINSSMQDTLIALITNADYSGSITDPQTNYSFEYKLFDYPAPGSIKLNENFNYHFSFTVNEPQVWSHSEFLNSELIGEHKFFTKYTYAFPNPFIYGKNTFIFIPVNSPGESVDLNIYSASMDLVFISSNHTPDDIIIDGQPGIRWDALNNKKERLASGVYIYAVKSGGETTLGKLVIFNE